MRPLLAALLLAAAPVAAQAAPLGPYSELAVFGDSLSDAGQFGFQLTNGDVWAAQLGAETSSGLNWAFATANAASNGDLVPDFYGPGSADDQVGFFLANQRFNPVAPDLGPNPIAAVWVGSNDLLGAERTPAGLQEAVAGAIGAIGNGIVNLSAEFDNFLLFNMPDLGEIPALSGSPLAPIASEVTAGFNAGLASLAGGLRDLGLNIIEVDIASLFDRALQDPSAFGFVNMTDSCNRGPVCDGLFYWDDKHPTEAGHAYIAAEVRRLVMEPGPTPVPLPASGAVLAAALGALVLLRRRVGRASA